MKLADVLADIQKLLDPAPRINTSIGPSYEGHAWLNNTPRVRCKDGFAVSIQASHSHYCTPRDSTGPWTEVELGFPSGRVPTLREYRDGPAPDTANVFGYVPIEKVAKVLLRHGGLEPRP